MHEFSGGPIHTGPLAGEWLPPADITEIEDRVFIKAELPGIEEKDIELSLLVYQKEAMEAAEKLMDKVCCRPISDVAFLQA